MIVTPREPNQGDAHIWPRLNLLVVRIVPETSFQEKCYEALMEANPCKMDTTRRPIRHARRAAPWSERLGVSRTPSREAISRGGARMASSRRCHAGALVVVSPYNSEIVDNRSGPAALESLAARLITTTARKKDISFGSVRICGARDFLQGFGKDRLPQDTLEEYSRPYSFHQALISLSEFPAGAT